MHPGDDRAAKQALPPRSGPASGGNDVLTEPRRREWPACTGETQIERQGGCRDGRRGSQDADRRSTAPAATGATGATCAAVAAGPAEPAEGRSGVAVATEATETTRLPCATRTAGTARATVPGGDGNVVDHQQPQASKDADRTTAGLSTAATATADAAGAATTTAPSGATAAEIHQTAAATTATTTATTGAAGAAATAEWPVPPCRPGGAHSRCAAHTCRSRLTIESRIAVGPRVGADAAARRTAGPVQQATALTGRTGARTGRR